MLLNNTGTQSDAGYGYGCPQGMVGQAGQYIESLRQTGNSPDI
jgi:hypothetical protein